MISALAQFLFLILNLFHKVTGSYALDIILLTLAIKALLFPFTFQQFKFSRILSKIQPEMKKLEKIKKQDPKKYQSEVMKLYEQYGINPFSGCLPLLLQLPVFIALFSLLRNPQINQGVFDTAAFLGMPLYVAPMITLMELPLIPEYVDMDVKEGVKYQYRIEPLKSKGKLEAVESPLGWVKSGGDEWAPDTPLPATLRSFDPIPGKVKASDGTLTGKVFVQWVPIRNATQYRVFRMGKEGKEQLVHTAMPGRSLFLFPVAPKAFYVDSDAGDSRKILYRVEAVLRDGTILRLVPDTGYPGRVNGEIEHISQGEFRNAVKIQWTNFGEAQGYEIKRRREGEPSFTRIQDLRPLLPKGSFLLQKRETQLTRWQVFYFPAWILIILYLTCQLIYQRQYKKIVPTTVQSPYFNPNFFLLFIVVISITFPVGLLLYFLTYSVAGIIETEMIYRALHPKSSERVSRKRMGKGGGRDSKR